MFQDRDVDQVLEGVTIRKRSDSSKLSIIMIDSDDRAATSAQVHARVVRKFKNVFLGKVSGSSFRGGIEFESKGRKIRLVFKETSSSKMGMNTALVEAAQCIYLAAAQAKRGDVTSSWVFQNMKKFQAGFHISTPVEKILDALDDGWRKSSELIANHVYQKMRHNNFVFHHDSPEVRGIYALYSKINKASRTFSRPDKWNPADIWAIRKGFRFNASHIESFDELNAYMRELIDKGEMLPISLKKVAKVPKITTENTNEAIQRKSSGAVIAAKTFFVAARVNTGKKDWTSSKNCKIELSKGKMDLAVEIRQSRPGAAVNGELKVRGTIARHGKISLAQLSRVFESLGSKIEIPNKQKLNKDSEDLDFTLIQKVFDLAKKLDPQSTMTMEKFREFINVHGKKDPDWLASKYESMLVLDGFSGLSKNDKHKAAERLYSQAAASDELAGPFLKVNQRV